MAGLADIGKRQLLINTCLACDIVRKPDGGLAVVEVSYGFVCKGNSPGFWDSNLNWHVVEYRPEHWMVDLILGEMDRKEVRSG